MINSSNVNAEHDEQKNAFKAGFFAYQLFMAIIMYFAVAVQSEHI